MNFRKSVLRHICFKELRQDFQLCNDSSENSLIFTFTGSRKQRLTFVGIRSMSGTRDDRHAYKRDPCLIVHCGERFCGPPVGRRGLVVGEGFVYTQALQGASLFAVTNCAAGGTSLRKRSSFSFSAENVFRWTQKNLVGQHLALGLHFRFHSARWTFSSSFLR